MTALLMQEDTLAKDPKSIEDFSTEAELLLNETKTLSLEEVILQILTLEKKARQAFDSTTIIKLVTYLLNRLHDEEKWMEINELFLMLCKKRGQLKQPIVFMVRLLLDWVHKTPNEQVKNELIAALSTVTQDKIFVEVERAKILRIKADSLEKEGKIKEAAVLLQEVQVETYSGMENREKIEYILNQMRLVIAINDFVRCQLISKKVSTKCLEETDFQDLKLQYYNYMCIYYLHEADFFNSADVCFHCFSTPNVKAGDEWKLYLENYVYYLITAGYSEKVLSTLRKNVFEKEIKFLDQLPVTKTVLEAFLSTELVTWPFSCEAEILNTSTFKKNPEFFEKFRASFIQHDVFMLAKYYKRIRLNRAAELLSISTKEFEECVSKSVTDNNVYARIDRPAGVICFQKLVDTQAKLDTWSSDIKQLLCLVEETSHLINNECRVQAALQKRKELLSKT